MKTIIFFLPAILSVEKERKENDSVYKIIGIYAKYCLLINLSMLIIFIIKGSMNYELAAYDSIKFYVLYIIGAMFLSWFLPIVLNILNKNFTLKIKGIYDEKKKSN